MYIMYLNQVFTVNNNVYKLDFYCKSNKYRPGVYCNNNSNANNNNKLQCCAKVSKEML